MNIIINILCVILGIVINLLYRKIVMHIYKIKRKVIYAEQIINENEKKKKFNKKYNLGEEINNDI